MIYSYLTPKDIFFLQKSDRRFNIEHPLAGYYQQIDNILTNYARDESFYGDNIGRSVNIPYENIEGIKYVHHRNEMLNALGGDSCIGDRVEGGNTETLNLGIFTGNRLKYSLSCNFMYDGIYLEYPNEKNLQDEIDNIAYVELEMGGMIINRVYQNMIKIQRNSIKNKKTANLLPILIDTINYNQPLPPISFYQERYIIVTFEQRPNILPKLFLSGNIFRPVVTFPISRLQRLVVQTQFSGREGIVDSLNNRLRINFNHNTYALFFVLNETVVTGYNNGQKIIHPDKIKTITLFINGSNVGIFSGKILRDLPNSLGLYSSMSNEETYYLLSLNNLNPFEYNLESFKDSINLSRIDSLRADIEFTEKFTGEVEVHGLYLNFGCFAGGIYGMMYT